MRLRNMSKQDKIRTLSNTLGKAGRLLRSLEAPTNRRTKIRGQLYSLLVIMGMEAEAKYVYQSWSDDSELRSRKPAEPKEQYTVVGLTTHDAFQRKIGKVH